MHKKNDLLQFLPQARARCEIYAGTEMFLEKILVGENSGVQPWKIQEFAMRILMLHSGSRRQGKGRSIKGGD